MNIGKYLGTIAHGNDFFLNFIPRIHFKEHLTNYIRNLLLGIGY